MDMYLTADGTRLQIPLLPDRMSVKTGATSISFQTIKGQEYKLPRGMALTGYSWNGVFPGESMALLSFVHGWQQPERIISTLERWMEDKKIIHFMVTETRINADVFIDAFVYDYYGAGNISYTITLSAYKQLTITTAPPQPEVTIPTEPEEPPVEEKPSDGKKPSDKKPQDKKDDKKTDTQKTKLTVNIPTTKIIDAVKSGINTATSLLSTFAENLKKSATNPATATKKVTVSSSAASSILTAKNLAKKALEKMK